MSEDGNVLFDLLARRLQLGAVVPVLGAGVNMVGRPVDLEHWMPHYLPSGRELARHLADRSAYPAHDDEDLARVSQYVTAMLGSRALYQDLHTIFDADYPLSDLHTFLALTSGRVRASPSSESCMLFVTTNYDDALERAFRRVGEPYDLITYIAQGEDSGRFRHERQDGTATIIRTPNEYTDIDFGERPVIAKIHGAVNRRRPRGDDDSYVITEDHYIEYTSRADPGTLLPIYVGEKLRDSHMLFLGYRLRDWNFRVLLYRVWVEQGALDLKSWAIDAHPDAIDQAAWSDRGVTIIKERLETFVAAMRLRAPDDAAV
jgi:hypothetical protein